MGFCTINESQSAHAGHFVCRTKRVSNGRAQKVKRTHLNIPVHWPLICLSFNLHILSNLHNPSRDTFPATPAALGAIEEEEQNLIMLLRNVRVFFFYSSEDCGTCVVPSRWPLLEWKRNREIIGLLGHANRRAGAHPPGEIRTDEYVFCPKPFRKVNHNDRPSSPSVACVFAH